jgi:Na+/alanine symporter
MFNQLMVIPNVIALLALSGLVAASAKAGSSEMLSSNRK